MSFFSKPVKTNDTDDEVQLNNYRKSGDVVVLGKLFEQYVSLIYGVCLKYLKDEEDAKDAVMGIFEELIIKVKQHDIKQFRSWVYPRHFRFCSFSAAARVPTSSTPPYLQCWMSFFLSARWCISPVKMILSKRGRWKMFTL